MLAALGGVGGGNWSVVNVRDYGALGDGRSDDTAAVQRALDALRPAGGGGGIVFVPAGRYLFRGSIVVPAATTLRGTYAGPPAHAMADGAPPPADGTVLLPTANRGNETAAPFLTLLSNAAVVGVVIYYPEQDGKQGPPAPYPYAIGLAGMNTVVTDVELLNPYNGIRAVLAHRHYIARVHGQPINIGIYVDQIYDIGRIEDVHWNPWWSSSLTIGNHQMVHGRAFVFGRTDWEYVLNCFSFGYAVGYHFIRTEAGACNGNFLGIGADLCTNASVLVEDLQPMGLQITNGEFTAFIDRHWCSVCSDEPTQVVVAKTNTGAVRFVNSAFWGPAVQVARLYGSATVGFTDCTFLGARPAAAAAGPDRVAAPSADARAPAPAPAPVLAGRPAQTGTLAARASRPCRRTTATWSSADRSFARTASTFSSTSPSVAPPSSATSSTGHRRSTMPARRASRWSALLGAPRAPLRRRPTRLTHGGPCKQGLNAGV